MTVLPNERDTSVVCLGYLSIVAHVHGVQIVNALINQLHVAEFCVDVEQVPIDRAGNAITNTFLHGNGPKAVG